MTDKQITALFLECEKEANKIIEGMDGLAICEACKQCTDCPNRGVITKALTFILNQRRKNYVD